MLKILELFGGIGACSKALERLGIEYEIVDYVEIDKYAVKSFNAIHNTNFEPQDICEWNKDIEVDLIMHGSPCQDFSLAGKQAGGDKDSGTRSSLMYETIRIVEKLKPKYVIWENVKNLLSKKHRHNFDAYLETMESLGYTNYYQVLNAKDYGIPQNRERVFTISILDNDNYEFPVGNYCDTEVINPLKDKTEYSWQFEQNVYDENGISRSLKAGGGSGNIPKVIETYTFPPKQELKLKLKDILEDSVDEKYYLSGEKVEKLKYTLEPTKQIKELPCCCNSTINEPKVRKISNCITARYDAGIQNQKQIGLSVVEVNRKYGIFDTEKQTHQAGSVYDKNGLAPTLDTMQGGWRQPCIEIKNNTKQSYLEATDGDGVYIQNIDRKRGTVQKEMIPTLKTSPDIGCVVDYPKGIDITWNDVGDTTDVARTLTTACRTLSKSQMTTGVLENNLRIRKLTPKECWRLMGFDDEDFEKAEKVNSNTQLYKQAGNSIVVNVLEAILRNLLLEDKQDIPKGQMNIYDYLSM